MISARLAGDDKSVAGGAQFGWLKGLVKFPDSSSCRDSLPNLNCLAAEMIRH